MRFEFFKKIRQKIDQIVTGRGKVDEDLFDELEELMIQADINVHTTQMVLKDLRLAVQEEALVNIDQVVKRLRNLLETVVESGAGRDGSALKVAMSSPTLYLIVGVNGVGKTTTIAKLTHMLQKRGKRVILAAGDTFRAAAIDQLEIW